MHPVRRNLHFIGPFQPLACIWPMADMQARQACAEIVGNYQRSAIAREVAHPHVQFESGLRHPTEVDYQRFRDELKRELRKAGIAIGKPAARRRGTAKARRLTAPL